MTRQRQGVLTVDPSGFEVSVDLCTAESLGTAARPEAWTTAARTTPISLPATLDTVTDFWLDRGSYLLEITYDGNLLLRSRPQIGPRFNNTVTPQALANMKFANSGSLIAAIVDG